jgi:hypothetical protein
MWERLLPYGFGVAHTLVTRVFHHVGTVAQGLRGRRDRRGPLPQGGRDARMAGAIPHRHPCCPSCGTPHPWDVPSVGPVKAWARRRDPVNDPLWKHYPIAMLFAKRLDNKGSKNNARTCAVGSSMLLIGTEL